MNKGLVKNLFFNFKNEDLDFLNLMKNNKFKQCPKCKMFVEKSDVLYQ